MHSQQAGMQIHCTTAVYKKHVPAVPNGSDCDLSPALDTCESLMADCNRHNKQLQLHNTALRTCQIQKILFKWRSQTVMLWICNIRRYGTKNDDSQHGTNFEINTIWHIVLQHIKSSEL